MDFNLSITSFEPDMQGVRNFVDLALSSPYTNAPTVMLVSSIGVFRSKSPCHRIVALNFVTHTPLAT